MNRIIFHTSQETSTRSRIFLVSFLKSLLLFSGNIVLSIFFNYLRMNYMNIGLKMYAVHYILLGIFFIFHLFFNVRYNINAFQLTMMEKFLFIISFVLNANVISILFAMYPHLVPTALLGTAITWGIILSIAVSLNISHDRPLVRLLGAVSMFSVIGIIIYYILCLFQGTGKVFFSGYGLFLDILSLLLFSLYSIVVLRQAIYINKSKGYVNTNILAIHIYNSLISILITIMRILIRNDQKSKR